MWRVRQYYDPLYCLTVMLLHFAAAWLLMVLVVWENSRRRDKTASLLSGVSGASTTIKGALALPACRIHADLASLSPCGAQLLSARRSLPPLAAAGRLAARQGLSSRLSRYLPLLRTVRSSLRKLSLYHYLLYRDGPSFDVDFHPLRLFWTAGCKGKEASPRPAVPFDSSTDSPSLRIRLKSSPQFFVPCIFTRCSAGAFYRSQRSPLLLPECF